MFKLIDCGMQVRRDGGRGLGGNAVLAVLINVEHGRSMRARQAIVKVSENKADEFQSGDTALPHNANMGEDHPFTIKIGSDPLNASR
ncbi:MAG TPA: hypothetical protein VN754_00690, partial [Candidatus Binataceae bacterium]|nr:hypothetical protein [Candidatus Binataceae bacterium]